MSAWNIFWVVVALWVLYLAMKNMPDLIRYWKIRSM